MLPAEMLEPRLIGPAENSKSVVLRRNGEFRKILQSTDTHRQLPHHSHKLLHKTLHLLHTHTHLKRTTNKFQITLIGKDLELVNKI